MKKIIERFCSNLIEKKKILYQIKQEMQRLGNMVFEYLFIHYST